MADEEKKDEQAQNDSRFGVEVPEGQLGNYFQYVEKDPTPVKGDEKDMDAFRDFIERLADKEAELPLGARHLLKRRDFDALWALWSEAVSGG